MPGDVVLLAAGDSVAADMRLVSINNLQVEEAALTGESVPVEKNTASVSSDAVLGDRTCMVYSGTLVTTGTATAVVTATGMGTELGVSPTCSKVPLTWKRRSPKNWMRSVPTLPSGFPLFPW